jgi:hypothetical protein
MHTTIGDYVYGIHYNTATCIDKTTTIIRYLRCEDLLIKIFFLYDSI